MNRPRIPRLALVACAALVLVALGLLLARLDHPELAPSAPEPPQPSAERAPERRTASEILESAHEESARAERAAPSPSAPELAAPAPPRPVQRGPWSYRGFALDLDLDQPLAGAELRFESDPALGPVRELFRCESDAQGRFRTQLLAEEPRWMRVGPPAGFLVDEERVDLRERRGEILVPLHRDPATLAGAIRGELLRESGPWTEETLPKAGTLMLDLVPTSGAKWSRRAEIVSEADGHGHYTLRYELGRLPRGEYELTLSSLGAFRWSPVALRVTPPAEHVNFLCYDLDRTTKLVFHVTDRESGAEIERFEVRQIQLTPSAENGVFLQTGPLATAAVPLDARLCWSLTAEGYQPAFGDESAFVRRGAESVAEVALERGWATEVLVLLADPAAKPAANAEVFVDGRSQGFTGEAGMLVLRAREAPQRIEVRYAGWKMQNDPLQAYNGKSAAQRGQVTVVRMVKGG